MFKSILLASALLLPACTAATTPTIAQEAHEQPAILSLSATGQVQIEPDMATVSAGAVSRADTASQALAENAALMQRVFAALDRAGIAEDDRQTPNLSVNPVYETIRSGNDDGNRRTIITGYEARNTVTATIRDLDNIGETIDALVTSGANQLNGLRFGREDTTEARNEARRLAVTELNALRDLYADAAGFQIVRIKSLNESGGYFPPPMAMMEADMAMSRVSSPVAAGELTISVTVNASWEIEG